MGATGAIVLALINRRLSWSLLRQAMNSTAKLTSFVIFILMGSTIFSLTFRGVNGDLWVEHLLTGLPGGPIGFLIVVNLLTFVLAFFLDFFELARPCGQCAPRRRPEGGCRGPGALRCGAATATMRGSARPSAARNPEQSSRQGRR